MNYSKVFLDSIGYELAPNVVTSQALEARVLPVYEKLGLAPGQLEGLTGIRERRWWDPGYKLSEGAIKAGLVVSCESAREINESMIASMLATPTMDHFKLSLATLTGGSGAVAVLITDGSFKKGGHRLLGGAYQAEPKHHELCRWYRDEMSTDAAAVLKYGTGLGRRTFDAMLKALSWSGEVIDKVICHQVGGAHRSSILGALGISETKDFSTYEYLGNIGTVSVPITAALADEREFLAKGDRVAFLGIGSGLNCLMLGWEW